MSTFSDPSTYSNPREPDGCDAGVSKWTGNLLLYRARVSFVFSSLQLSQVLLVEMEEIDSGERMILLSFRTVLDQTTQSTNGLDQSTASR